MYRIGIDVGGTNTDAVVMQNDKVLLGVKNPTTEDVMTGVIDSLKEVIEKTEISKDEISSVMIGTTHFTNAVVERQRLSQTAAVRLCLPAAQCLPPMVDWPEDIKSSVGGKFWMAKGGNEFDGREISSVDEDELLGIAEAIGKENIDSVAICSVFSPVNDDMEKKALSILRTKLPNADFTLSSEIGRLGILERENAAIMNASLRNLGKKTVDAFGQALKTLGISCPYFITQNDGTLMGADFAKSYPVLTFASGPTNSMRGASFLTGEQNAIVVDVGGTSTDVGALIKGFPRPATTSVDVGGVRTNFRMPDVYSIALGGGSIVKNDPNVTVGPKSVGYNIHKEAVIFGGSTVTTTDIAVGLGIADIGDAEKAKALGNEMLTSTKEKIDTMITDAVERMRVSSEAIPVLAVGGGSILIPEKVGDLPVVKPENFAVANAVGAAIGQISGEVDRIFSLANKSRDEVLAEAKDEATKKAISAGAKAETIELLDQEDVPLAYLPGNATRVRLKVVGDLDG